MAEPPAEALRGVGASPGRGAGPVVLVADHAVPEPSTDLPPGGPPQGEVRRALDALEEVAADLEARGARVGGEAADVLMAQAMMARDPSLADDIRRRAEGGASAARAVFDAFGVYRTLLAGAGEYLAGRVADLDDVRNRALALLMGLPAPGVPALTQPSVVVARDLAPADTALLDVDLVVAVVTEQGGPTSHTAILARSLGIPAVVACRGALGLVAGEPVLVDGNAGEVRRRPTPAEVQAIAGEAARRRAALAAAQQLTGPGRLRDGTALPLLANVGAVADAAAATGAGAEGVGLLRTEFAFLDRHEAPSEPEQTEVYAALMRPFAGQRVVARVLDAGADKPLPFLSFSDEPNPALGVRGLRALLESPDLLRTQLRALRAAGEQAGVTLEVMAPMVATPAEAAAFVEVCREEGLTGPVGVMVEVPAAAIRARDVTAVVDFVSIGTNDLAQYLFAADRQVGAVAALQDAWQPALLDLVATVADACRAAGKPCGVCGEAAADPMLACVLVGLGVTSLSMGAPALPLVRAALAAHDLDQCQAAARAARSAVDPLRARQAARAVLGEDAPDRPR